MKYVKMTIGILLVALFLWVMGVQVPFIANHARGQIEKGMSVTQVTDIVTSYVKKPDICRWERDGLDKPIFSTRKQCAFPKDALLLKKGGKNIKLSVTFMGPAFLHNDFHVIFDGSGNVLSVSEVRHWD